MAEKAVSRLRDVYGTEYHVGTGADLLCTFIFISIFNSLNLAPASGGSDDWAKEKLGVRYVYLIELRPHNDCKIKCANIMKHLHFSQQRLYFKSR